MLLCFRVPLLPCLLASAFYLSAFYTLHFYI
jgi:hypothetical protein